jgi:hypothetical protein
MPRFLITQKRDATKYWLALIDADTKAEAHRKAEDDDCEWIEGHCEEFDDREIPIDEIEQVDTDYKITPDPLRARIWKLRIDNADDSPSTQIYGDEPSALIAFEAALTPYMTGDEPTRFAGDPRAAYDAILARDEDGEFPYGHIVELTDQIILVTPTH